VFHARHVPDLDRRSIILTQLSSSLKEPKFLEEALAVAREIQEEGRRASALARIALKFQDSQKRMCWTKHWQQPEKSKREGGAPILWPRSHPDSRIFRKHWQ